MVGKGWLHRIVHFNTMLENCLVLVRCLSILELFFFFLTLTIIAGDNDRVKVSRASWHRENNDVEIILH